MPLLKAIIGGDAKGLERELEKVRDLAHETGEAITEAFGEKLGEVASVGFLEESIRRTIEYAEQVSVLAQRLGISTDAVQAWDYALKMSGSSIEAATGFFEKLATARQKAMDGDAKAVRSFQNLGVALNDLKNLRLEDLGAKIAEAFQTGDPQALIADLREVGGRGAGELVAAFRDGLADSVKEARDAGVIISNEVLESLREAAEKSKTIWMQFVAQIAPAISWLSDKLEKAWRGLNMMARYAVGFAQGGHEGGMDLVSEYIEQFQELDRQAEERRAKRAQGFTGGIGEGDESNNLQAQREAKREQELEDRLDKLKEKNYLKSLSHEERLSELRRMKASAEEIAATPGLTAAEKLQEQIRAEEYQSQIAEESATKQKLAHGHLTDLQKVGAFAQVPTLVDVNQKQLHELKGIHKALLTGGKRGEFGKVKY